MPRDRGRAPDRRLGEGGPRDHGRGRARGARARTARVRFLRGGETTRAPGSLADRGFTAGRPNGKWLTDVTGIRAGDGKGVPLAAGRLPRRQDRRACRRVRSRRGAGRPDAGGSGCRAARGRASPGALRPRRASPDGWRSRPSTTEKWEERPRGEVLALIDEYIHWHDHERIKQSPGWMSPVQYRQSQGTAA